jgi:hypothetical protein
VTFQMTGRVDQIYASISEDVDHIRKWAKFLLLHIGEKSISNTFNDGFDLDRFPIDKNTIASLHSQGYTFSTLENNIRNPTTDSLGPCPSSNFMIGPMLLVKYSPTRDPVQSSGSPMRRTLLSPIVLDGLAIPSARAAVPSSADPIL